MIGTLIVSGLGTGILSTLFGVGGGTIIVPVLYFLYPELPPTLVIGTSLGVILVNSLLNTYLFHKKGFLPSKQVIIALGAGMAIGGMAGFYAAELLSARFIKIFLACVLLIVSFRLVRKKKITGEQSAAPPAQNAPLLFGTGTLGGVISGMTGLGGGSILTPILIEFFKTPLNKIPAFTNVAMAFAAISGIIKSMTLSKAGLDIPYASYSIGHVHIMFIGVIFLGAFFGAKIGIYLGNKIPQRKAELLFSLFLFLVSSKLFHSAL